MPFAAVDTSATPDGGVCGRGLIQGSSNSSLSRLAPSHSTPAAQVKRADQFHMNKWA